MYSMYVLFEHLCSIKSTHSTVHTVTDFLVFITHIAGNFILVSLNRYKRPKPTSIVHYKCGQIIHWVSWLSLRMPSSWITSWQKAFLSCKYKTLVAIPYKKNIASQTTASFFSRNKLRQRDNR